jgi:hypothetical protein
MLKLYALSRYEFDTPEKAHALLELLAEAPVPPQTFGSSEPAREKLVRDSWPEAARMLCSTPQRSGGTIFFQSKKPRSTIMIQWSSGSVSEWYWELDDAVLARAGGAAAVADFMGRLFREFPAVFAGVSPEEEWHAKHWLVEKLEYGRMEQRVGFDLQGCLPGVYWMTVFGKELVEHFGAARLRATPVAQAMDLGAGGMALVLETGPAAAKQRALAAEEDRLREAIGDEYFFDITRRDRRCTPVPGLSDAPPG